MTTDYFEDRFIAGLCRIWCKRITGDNQLGWMPMTYPSRGWSDCVRIVEDYLDNFGNDYIYEITADLDVCRPRW